MFKLLFKQFKGQIFFIIFFSILESASRLGFSVLFQYELYRVTDLGQGDNKKIAYVMAFCCGIIWMIGQIGRHNSYY
jgi:hypothetical protein